MVAPYPNFRFQIIYNLPEGECLGFFTKPFLDASRFQLSRNKITPAIPGYGDFYRK
jgi:hypothetical protein